MAAYYNDNNRESAAMLRQLIADGICAPGYVDERSITEVKADDLKGYTQCHFFAGIGGWSIALRLAGWPDERPVWTGSAPCQPFSSAGRQKGKADERHLFPVWLDLISHHRPPTIFGEQVATAVAHGWLDDVYQGLEAEGYAVGAAVLPACSVGAPHKRDRLWFVAHASGQRGGRARGPSSQEVGRPSTDNSVQPWGTGADGYVANANCDYEGRRSGEAGREGEEVRVWSGLDAADAGQPVGDPQQQRLEVRERNPGIFEEALGTPRSPSRGGIHQSKYVRRMRMEKAELLPCPFCGSTKITETTQVAGHGDSSGVAECECGARMVDYYHRHKEKWNTRTKARQEPFCAKAEELIRAERARQQTVENWLPQHDDRHTDGALFEAGMCYYRHAKGMEVETDEETGVPELWPWDIAAWKPKTVERDLERAGALFTAELERLQRAEVSPADMAYIVSEAMQEKCRYALASGMRLAEVAAQNVGA